MISVKTAPAGLDLPAPLKYLEDLAYNLWWTWRPEAQALFETIDSEHWQAHRNPVMLLRETNRERLAALAEDENFCRRVAEVYGALIEELSRDTWVQEQYSDHQNILVAYLCTEFGFHECLPLYSGGLGVLAGDHAKSASDIGLPFVGVGLLYRHGYFQQEIDGEGNQVAHYPPADYAKLPLRKVVNEHGQAITVQVGFPDGEVHVQAWLAEVGRSRVLFLDTDFEANSEAYRALTHQLYGGDRDMRISQEIVLGIGGVRMLRALGISPTVWHMNEGHVAFSALERIREFMQTQNLAFPEACEAVRANTVFTTHTPVPAGNEAFSLPRLDIFLRDYSANLGIRFADLLKLGVQADGTGAKFFSMTVLAIRLSCITNGVSKLHGAVSRNMWQHLWDGVPLHEIPITSITNGVHTQSWIAPRLATLFAEKLSPDWERMLADPEFWNKIYELPAGTLRDLKAILKARLIETVRARLRQTYRRIGKSEEFLQQIDNWLQPDALTIGFARRFAQYKRATLLLRDRDRLARLVNDPERPLQVIYAGKAHPQDDGGKALIREIWEAAQQPEFLGKIILLENYDMQLGRLLVQGVDVWLNNPRRPREASGTSGQKVPINAGLNFSVLDGWWPEAFNHENGWKIGEALEFATLEQQDEHDAQALYATLENEIIPRYYAAEEHGEERVWDRMTRASMATVIPAFSTERMLRNYFTQAYKPASDRFRALVAENLEHAVALARDKQRIAEQWPFVHFTHTWKSVHPKEHGHWVDANAKVYLGELSPDAVQVELYCEPQDPESGIPPQTFPLHMTGMQNPHEAKYEIRTDIFVGPDPVLKFRVFPRHPRFLHAHELGLITWKELEL